MEIRPGNNRSGFTLTECAVVIATAAFILVLPCLAGSGNRERINRVVCLNNLRQMGVGSFLYAAGDRKGRLAGSLPDTSNPSRPGDDLNWLYGYGPSRVRYIQDTRTFACPSTKNYVRTNGFFNFQSYTLLLDLYRNAVTTRTPGHSYEVVSFWVAQGAYSDKTLSSTATHRNMQGVAAGTIPGPSKTILMHDAMDTFAGSGALQNYPNPYVGHGSDGGNILFCDGHAEWIDTANWSRTWSIGIDTGLVGL